MLCQNLRYSHFCVYYPRPEHWGSSPFPILLTGSIVCGARGAGSNKLFGDIQLLFLGMYCSSSSLIKLFFVDIDIFTWHCGGGIPLLVSSSHVVFVGW